MLYTYTPYTNPRLMGAMVIRAAEKKNSFNSNTPLPWVYLLSPLVFKELVTLSGTFLFFGM